MLSRELAEDVGRDREARELALDAFRSFVSVIKLAWPQLKNVRTSNPRFPAWVRKYKGFYVSPIYAGLSNKWENLPRAQTDNLHVILALRSPVQPEASSFNDGNDFYIIMPLVQHADSLKDLIKPSSSQSRTWFMHEFAHYQDRQRSKWKQSQVDGGPLSGISAAKYFGSDSEFNAHYQDGLDRLLKAFNAANKARLAGPMIASYKGFYDQLVVPNYHRVYLTAVTGKWKRKLAKRLYSLYLDLKQLVE